MTTSDPRLAAALAAAAGVDPAGGELPGAAAGRAALLALATGGQLVAPADQVAAAALLVVSDVVAEVAAAQSLAWSAMRSDDAAKRIAAAAFDRLRLLAGRPQKFGTQVVVRDGRRELWPVEPGTTDSERAKWGVPPLAELVRACGGGT